MEKVREVVFYKEYFQIFFEKLNEKTKNKIDEVLFMITILEKIPSKFFKSVAGEKGLYEIRVKHQSNIYRIFCCLDKGKLVVLFNGFQKKKQKTPLGEIEKAKKIMIEYFNEQKE